MKRGLELNPFPFSFSISFRLFVWFFSKPFVNKESVKRLGVVQVRRSIIEKTDWKRLVNKKSISIKKVLVLK